MNRNLLLLLALGFLFYKSRETKNESESSEGGEVSPSESQKETTVLDKKDVSVVSVKAVKDVMLDNNSGVTEMNY